MIAGSSQLGRLLAVGLAWALAAAGALVLDVRLLTAAWATVDPAGPGARFDELVGGLALVVLAAAVTWLSVAVTMCVVAESGRLGRRLAGPLAAAVAPRRMRLLIRLACGVAVAAPLGTLPASAAEPAARSCDSAACVTLLAALPLPDRPDVVAHQRAAARPTPPATPAETSTADAGAVAAAAAATGPAATAGPNVVTVRPGDSLWSIAAAHLPDDAGATDVARAWPRWYQANRALIGDDPDCIHPGTVLVEPADPDQPAARRPAPPDS